MEKTRKMAYITMFVGIMMISFGMVLQDTNNLASFKDIIKKTGFKLGNYTASAKTNVVSDEKHEEVLINNLLLSEAVVETAPASFVPKVKTYDEMTLDELNAAVVAGTLKMEYSAFYTNSSSRLTKSKGAQYFNGHKETYYSQRVLPGNSLRIPGRHVADDGTIRDGDGYICVAADSGYLSRGSVVVTSLGPGKVYDTGCAYGVIDIYTNW